jgi:hypothetical protein
MTLSLPEFQPDKLTKALEQSIYNAHKKRETNHSATILILPDWKYTPYLARSLHTKYVQTIATLPHTNTTQGKQHTQYNLNIYIIANSKAQTRLDATNIQDTLKHNTYPRI